MDLATLRRTLRQRLESDRRFGMTHLPQAESQFDLSFLRELALKNASVSPSQTTAGGLAGTGQPDTRNTPAGPPAAPRAVPATGAGQALFEAAPEANQVESTTLPAGEHVTPPNRVKSKLPRDKRVAELTILRERVAQCVRCPELAETRTKTVFGSGNPEAAILFLGEAPGADEDKTGEPFVGRAGQLLDRIIGACRLTREEIYICNILRCRPPGNRNPTPTEAFHCREYLSAQLSLVDPDYIVCWGRVAAENLLGTKESIGKLRKRFFKYGRSKVAVTYHPSYLLRNPAAKKDVWDDLKWLFRDLGVDLEAPANPSGS